MRKEYRDASVFYNTIRGMISEIGEVYRKEVERTIEKNVKLYNLIIIPQYHNGIENKENTFGLEIRYGFVTNVPENDINIINPVAMLNVELTRNEPGKMTYRHSFEVLGENPLTEQAIKDISEILQGYDSHSYTYTVDYVDFMTMLDLESLNIELAQPYVEQLQIMQKASDNIWNDAQKEFEKTQKDKKVKTGKKKKTS